MDTSAGMYPHERVEAVYFVSAIGALRMFVLLEHMKILASFCRELIDLKEDWACAPETCRQSIQLNHGSFGRYQFVDKEFGQLRGNTSIPWSISWRKCC
jgi:hypothetical protein